MRQNTNKTNWKTVLQFLPAGWKEKAVELGALQRSRNVGPSELLRIFLIHLADDCSLKEATLRAKLGQIGTISPVALFKRLKKSSEWLRWMSVELLKARTQEVKKPLWLSNYRVRSIDATVVNEPGSTGTDWRLHYSFELFTLHCDHFLLTRSDVGEGLVHFPVQPGDLFIGDRAYGTLHGFWHVKGGDGDFIVRLKKHSLRLFWRNKRSFHLLRVLSRLAIGEIGEWIVEARNKSDKPMKIRLVCLKKSDEQADLAMQRSKREMIKKKRAINQETLELQRYVILATSLMDKSVTKEQIAALYRYRWQIEIAFKRLKSILGLGHLPKKNITSAKAWLHGKIFVSLLVQAIVDEGRFFSPWGYPIRCSLGNDRQFMAGDIICSASSSPGSKSAV